MSTHPHASLLYMGSGARILSLLLARQTLYHLSYLLGPDLFFIFYYFVCCNIFLLSVGTRLRLHIVRSNRLRYFICKSVSTRVPVWIRSVHTRVTNSRQGTGLLLKQCFRWYEGNAKSGPSSFCPRVTSRQMKASDNGVSWVPLPELEPVSSGWLWRSPSPRSGVFLFVIWCGWNGSCKFL